MLDLNAAYKVCLSIPSWLQDLKDDFYLNFIKDDRYMYIVKGLGTTLEITVFAVILGVFLGVIAAIIRSTYDKTKTDMRPGPGQALLAILNAIVKLYLTVIRGTPVVVQLMITYYIIFASSTNQLLVAVLAFGFKSRCFGANTLFPEIVALRIVSSFTGSFVL